jgi:ribonuclease BN (tRNA processing enzyme)
VKITVLGCSGTSPTRTTPASGYLVEAAGDSIWIDAGTGTFMGLAAHVDPGNLTGVVLSHMHVDHCSDLFGLAGYLAYGPSGTVPVPVYLPPGGADLLTAFAGAGAEHAFNTVLRFVTVEPADTVTVGSITLSFGAAVHPVPALTVRLTSASTTMAYSGDTGPGSDLRDTAKGCDLLLCEASLTGDRDDTTYPYHLTAFEAGREAATAGADRLVITHLGHTVDPATAVNEATSGFGKTVELAAPGATFQIGAT